MPKVGVILSGCGVYDGSEIHEAVCVLLALDELGADAACVAPRKPLAVVDHLTGEATGEERDVLVESARIARGAVTDLASVHGGEFDAIVLPGGFGAAKNLCTFAADGAACEVDPEVARVLREAHAAGRPLGFACIAPAVAAKVFGYLAPALTIGHDADTASTLEAMGARHVACDVTDTVVDEKLRIVTTPAYMEAGRIGEAWAGIRKMVEQVLDLTAAAKP